MRPVRIKLLKSLLIGSHTHAAGEVAEVHPARAEFFIQAQLATRALPEAEGEAEVEGEGPEAPTSPPGFATASRKAGRRRASTLVGENAGA